MAESKLPTTAAGWVGLCVFVAVAALTAYQVSKGNWIAVALGALGALGTALKAGVYPK